MGNVSSATPTPDNDAIASNLPLLPTLLRTQGDVNWGLVRQVLQQSPEQACLYAHGVQPSWLYVAVQRQAPTDILQLLLAADENAVDQLSPHGGSLLHIVQRADHVRFLLSQRPQLAQVKDQTGRLPLHVAGNSEIAKFLIEAYPRALTQRSDLGSLPLHLALRKDVLDHGLIQTLAAADPSTLLVRDKKGNTPLTLLVRSLEQQFDDTLWNLMVTWVSSNLPCDTRRSLHALIRHGCCDTQPMMEVALSHFSVETRERDHLGRTPLHIAAQRAECQEGALEALIQANRVAPRMTDNDGRLPIDLAAESPYTQPHTLTLLVKGEPRALHTRDLLTRRYPFQTSAMSSQKSVTNTYILLRSRPEVLSYYHTP